MLLCSKELSLRHSEDAEEINSFVILSDASGKLCSASEQADFVHVFPKPRNPVGCLFALSSNKPVVKSVSWPAGSAVYAYSEHTAASQSHDSVCPTLLFTPL